MESILSTIFPCCFPSRSTRSHTQRDHNERTPLLGDGSGSIASPPGNSIAEGATSPGSGTARFKRKPNSILPSPAYDANALKSIIDDLKGKLIPVDSATTSEKGATLLLEGAESAEEAAKSSEETAVESSSSPTTTKHVTPVHTLRLSVSTASNTRTSSHAPLPKLVDIWSESGDSTASASASGPAAGTSTAAVGSTLSYSAAVKKGKKGGKNTKRFPGAPKPLASSSSDSGKGGKEEASVEQRTYESLAEIARSKPLVHDWDLDDGSESAPAA